MVSTPNAGILGLLEAVEFTEYLSFGIDLGDPSEMRHSLTWLKPPITRDARLHLPEHS